MCRALGLLWICSLIGIVKGLNPGVISRWSVIVWAIVEALPGGGGGSHVTRLNFKRLVSVFLNACCLLLALLSLWQFGRGRLSLVARCCYLFGHVACQNLPWQGLIVVLNRTFVDSE